MNAYYLYTIKLNDLISPSLKKAMVSSNAFFNKFNQNTNKFTNNTKRLPNNIDGLNQKLLWLQNRRDKAFDIKKIRLYNEVIRKTERRLNKLKNLPPLSITENFRKIGESIGNLTGLTGGLAIGLGAIGGIKSILSLGSDLEQTRVSFQTMLGSVEQGNKMIENINNFANATPFENKVLEDNAKLLLNFGTAQEKVIPTLKMLGDVSGGNKEKLNSLSLAYAQIQSTGKLMGQDLLQMINAGFNPLKVISDETGESMSFLKEKMSKGKKEKPNKNIIINTIYFAKIVKQCTWLKKQRQK